MSDPSSSINKLELRVDVCSNGYSLSESGSCGRVRVQCHRVSLDPPESDTRCVVSLQQLEAGAREGQGVWIGKVDGRDAWEISIACLVDALPCCAHALSGATAKLDLKRIALYSTFLSLACEHPILGNCYTLANVCSTRGNECDSSCIGA